MSQQDGRFEVGASPWNKGKHTIGTPHTEATKNKMRLAKLGDLNPAKRKEVREKISKSLKGRFVGENNWFYGKTHPKETIQKIMNTEGWKRGSYKKGHVCHTQREEVRKKISNTLKGRKHTEEERNNITIGVTNKWAECGYPLIGEKSPLWKGGISFEPYCPKFNNQLKERIRIKYGRKCFLCGCFENGRKLAIHHVDYDKTQGCNGKEFRLIPLCGSCHGKTTTKNRDHYTLLFNDRLNKQNIEVFC